MRKCIGILFFIFTISVFIFAQNEPTLLIPYSSSNISIDGDLSDWDNYFSYSFQDTTTFFKSTGKYKIENLYPDKFNFSKIKGPKSRNKVIFNSCWNTQNLFFAFKVWDKHLFAEVKSLRLKPRVHLNDGVEIYLDTKDDSRNKMDLNDYQFLIDIKNETEVFRGNLKESLIDTIAVPKEFAQNILFEHSVKVYGSINKHDNTDSLYIIEIAIPFAAIGLHPKTGMKMKLDACVNDIDYPAASAIQIEEASTIMWAFNWSGISDFGFPNTWKSVKLIGTPPWFESISEKYKDFWFYIYSSTLTISLIIISFLFYVINKRRKLPTSEQISKEKIIFVNTIDQKTTLSHNEKTLKQASEFIIQNKSVELHSEEVAKNIGISLRNFQRITKEELNTTPTHFICIVKLNLSAEYLKNKEGNITEAAYEFGFSDPSYFSKTFKNHFGLSPSEFLKNNT